MEPSAALFHDEATRYWSVQGYDAARQVLGDPSFTMDDRLGFILSRLEASGHAFPALRRLVPAITFFVDPPRHGPARRLLARLLGHHPLSVLRPRIDAIAGEVLAAGCARRGKEFDLVSDFARPLAVRSIAVVLGLEQAEGEELAAGSEQLIDLLEMVLPLRRFRALDRIAEAMMGLVLGAIARRRARPSDDALSAVVAELDAAGAADDDTLAASCVFLFMAGVETSLSSVSAAARMVLTDPDACAGLRADPGRLPAVVEDVLRLHSAVHWVVRVAGAARTVDGVAVPQGARLTVILGAANRDPSRFPPDTCPLLDQGGGPPHLAFGDRLHFCLGAQLARAVIASALSHLLREPRLMLCIADEVWARRETVRSLVSLPVRVGETTA